MIIQTIALAIFVLSLGGVLLILARKMPVLNSLPLNAKINIRNYHLISDIENRIKEIFISFEKQILLHKFLSWVKIMTLRVETRIDAMLHKIRKEAQRVDGELKIKKVLPPR